MTPFLSIANTLKNARQFRLSSLGILLIAMTFCLVTLNALALSFGNCSSTQILFQSDEEEEEEEPDCD